MTTSKARNGEIELAYETIGPPDGEPLLLITGVSQMIAWPDGFCGALVERGFRVTRFDNRDTGLSTHLRDAGPPAKRPCCSGARQRWRTG
jgi:pimeloyl-ACP methyl ester carboxylesterase